MRSFLMVLRIIMLSILAAILTVIGIFISHRSTTNFVWAVMLWVAAFVCVFFIRRALPQKPSMGWKAEAIGIGVFALFAIGAWLGEWWDYSVTTRVDYPTFQSLHKTTGVLKKGSGGVRYLTMADRSTLRLVCAAMPPHRRKGGPRDNWCLYGNDEPYLDQVVTVFHTVPFKVSSMRAHFYEIRSGNSVLISYKDAIELKKSIVQGIARFDPTLPALLTVLWLYYVFELWMLRIRPRKAP